MLERAVMATVTFEQTLDWITRTWLRRSQFRGVNPRNSRYVAQDRSDAAAFLAAIVVISCSVDGREDCNYADSRKSVVHLHDSIGLVI